MKSTVSRITLALVFCLGMLVTANSATLGQREREKGERQKCLKECQEKYKEQSRDCKGKRGEERRVCQQQLAPILHGCRTKCSPANEVPDTAKKSKKPWSG